MKYCSFPMSTALRLGYPGCWCVGAGWRGNAGRNFAGGFREVHWSASPYGGIGSLHHDLERPRSSWLNFQQDEVGTCCPYCGKFDM